ncbi:HK97-gp10 family putative phage morphogenesis protein [Sphingomonas sp.]|uniref:HK97-gp10 family putative phage morphogenesis protein n=1 Tax=Sphingomonas sp. TaxID=28214 RepID=UPI002FDA82DC
MPKIAGVADFRKKLSRITSPEAKRQVGAALFAAGEEIEVEAALSITNGAVSGKGHVPSAPGSPPNADTHQLDRSIETNQVTPLRVEVSANAPYAIHLEFGTSKMAARPFMAPALARKRDDAAKLVARAIAHISKGGKVT